MTDQPNGDEQHPEDPDAFGGSSRDDDAAGGSETGPPGPEADAGDEDRTQQIQHRSVGARVPEHVQGVFSTGAIVMTGPNEVVLDFVTRMARPHRVAARIVMTPRVLGQFLRALEDNLAKFRNRFGDPPAMPEPAPGAPSQRPSVEEIYNDLKVPETMLSGVYANSVMIGHSAAEFSIDFITSFYPNAAVASRVYMSAPQIPRLIQSVRKTHDRLQRGENGGERNDGSDSDSDSGGDPDGPALT